ncbi:hypothetical protein EJ02DRAFT_187626 [Clathrospora elynae]|uniref:Uncharacterized protein n=1 Tax=Clathrospora elynae TaxID=706981 RepID=A0A6A5SQB3_9PLEO|nr:hypothetical protein EJ02DRAFT_187626 [Clathrospora elynae]
MPPKSPIIPTPATESKSVPPKNTPNREYFGTEQVTGEPVSDVESFSMSSSPSRTSSRTTSPSSAKQTPTKQKQIMTTDNEEDDLVGVSRESMASPTASDILLTCDLEDVIPMGDLQREMLGQGVRGKERKERKERLLELLERLRAEREREKERG